MDGATRDYFEPRFGADFGRVRIHAGPHAGESARAINARAYTLGSAVVFGAGEYQPETIPGKRLLAHELTHVVQQNGGTARLQRKLFVDGPIDASDPAARIPQPARASMVESLIHSLCPAFRVNAASGGDEVQETVPGTCDDPGALTAGAYPTGCCCMCVMINTPNVWTIRVTQNEGAYTHFPDIVIPPSTSVIESMHWSEEGATSPAHLVGRPRQITLGHELCGHAALMEINAHPARADRTSTDVHDPTIKIERLLWGEQGLPSAEQRGLARSPASAPSGSRHRGESVSRVTVARFPFNSHDVSQLPASERAKINTAKEFIATNDWFVDVLGHSDPAGSAAAKMDVSERRAEAVKREIERDPRISPTVTRFGPSMPRFTRVEGLSDSEPLSSGTAHELWRRVDILTANFPAGAQVPPPGTPTIATGVPPRNGTAVLQGLISTDACVRHLTQGAWL